ncbi:hypothetical protein KKC60_00770 [Patescibacteria group bacterium]|nr:hypothetical protein [Patescibacteria group bacterium]
MASLNHVFTKYIFALYWVAAVINAAIVVLFFNGAFIETLLQSILFWVVGVLGVVSFFMHWRRKTADRLARNIGWEPGSPFQKEVAAAGGAFGILGILSTWIMGDFWTATVIGVSFMLFMMGVGHIIDLKKRENKSILNTGAVLYSDILGPIVMVVLLVLWKMGM